MAEYAIYDGVAHPVVSRLPDGWGSSWMPPPAYDATSVNGKADVCGLLCNVLDTGNRNYFSCIAVGAYTVSVYADATATTLISTQNVASGVQANWQIDYAACTHQFNTDTRQAWVEVVPQSGQSLTMLRFNTNHPAETNPNSSPSFVAAVGAIPNLTNATSMFQQCYSLQSVNLPNLPNLTTATSMFLYCYALQSVNLPNLSNLTTATGMFLYCYALQSVNLPNLPNLTTATNMFGTTVESACLRSLRRLVTPDITIGFALQYGAVQAEEINALFTSLGTASGAQTIDVRNQPGSATCDTSIATAKGYTVLTA